MADTQYPTIVYPHELPTVPQAQPGDLLFLEQKNQDGSYTTY